MTSWTIPKATLPGLGTSSFQNRTRPGQLRRIVVIHGRIPLSATPLVAGGFYRPDTGRPGCGFYASGTLWISLAQDRSLGTRCWRVQSIEVQIETQLDRANELSLVRAKPFCMDGVEQQLITMTGLLENPRLLSWALCLWTVVIEHFTSNGVSDLSFKSNLFYWSEASSVCLIDDDYLTGWYPRYRCSVN